MLGGTLKTKTLDAAGSYSLGIPTIETHVNQEGRGWCGTLVYKLSAGHMFVEVWFDDPDDSD